MIEATCPAAGVSWPSFSKPVWTSDLSRQSEVWRSPESLPLPLLLLDEVAEAELLDAVLVDVLFLVVEEDDALVSVASLSVAPVAAIRVSTSD